MRPERTPEEKLRAKRTNAVVMMAMGGVFTVCALAAGLIAIRPGEMPGWMTGAWIRRAPERFRTARPSLVDFAPLGPEVLARARAEKKPVFLHLTAVWSSRAKEVESETYGDPATAALLARDFVPATADAELRPGLARRYGVGSWPALVVLAPDGRAVAAAAGLPPSLLRPFLSRAAEILKDHPEREAPMAADAEQRFAAVRALPPRDPASFPLDPVWGGAFHGRGEYAKVLADQAAVVASTDSARAKSVLRFADAFLALPGGGWAASAAGEVALKDGRVARGAYYFSLDDAARRKTGLPAVDRRVLPGPNRAMAEAVLKSPVATRAEKTRARAVLRRFRAAR
jgi:hypothetical protein